MNLAWARYLVPVIGVVLCLGISFTLSSSQAPNSIRSDATYILDRDGALTPEQALQKQFIDANGRFISPEKSYVWVRLAIPQAVMDWEEEPVLFTGSNETLLSIRAYLSGTVLRELGPCGVAGEYSNCSFISPRHAFAIKRSSLDSARAILLRLEPGAGVINNEFFFMRRSLYGRVDVFLNFLLGLATGVGIFVVLMSLSHGISLGEKGYLVYACFYLNLVISMCVNRGVWDFFKPDWPAIHGADLMLPLLYLTTFFDLLFIRVFFDIFTSKKLLGQVCRSFLAICLGMAVFAFIQPASRFGWMLLFPIIVAGALLALSTLGHAMWRNRRWAGTITTAWVIAITGIFVWVGFRRGFFGGRWYFGYIPIMTRVLESFILCVAIFQKLQRLSQNLAFSRAKADEATIVKTLLRTLSHDISNTTQIIGLGIAMTGPQQSDSVNVKNRERIRKAIEAQEKIIETAKRAYLVRGGDLLECAPVELNECTREISDMFTFRFNQKDQNISMDLAPEPLFIMAERTSLCYQVMANLLTNASKFSPVGSTIQLRTIAVSQDCVELIVRDEGIGIPSDILEHLFDENVGVTRPGTNGERGSGDGFLIVRNFVSAFGGKVIVDSTVGKGTEIKLHFARVPGNAV